MTVTKLYKKFSTSWPHEHPGLNFHLAFIAISQKQEQGQPMESAEEVSRQLTGTALPCPSWEMCLSNCPCFQSCLPEPQISCGAWDCYRTERWCFFKFTLPSHCPLQEVILWLYEQNLWLHAYHSRTWVAGPKQYVGNSGAPLISEINQ